MRLLVHLSDLHFGRIEHELLQPLTRKIVELRPHLVVVSGDLTQRARVQQFQEARRFLDQLPKPQLVVPGNHDVPLYNLYQRFFRPLDKFRRFISADPDPAYVDEEIAVVGVNTARSLVFKGGRINEEQIERVRQHLCTLGESITKVLVSHHPFDLPAHADERAIVGRAALAMKALARCGADLLLSGHMHASHTGDTAQRYRMDSYAALVVQAGTATSTRGRGEANSFNVLRVEGPQRMQIDRMEWSAQARDFVLAASETFSRTSLGWSKEK
jgi:3',5'-cyclic AMP phosphodiesterase CpdA